MPEEMRLWATIVPRIDLSSLRDAIRQGLQESISVSLQGTGASSGTPSGGGGGAGGGGAGGSVSGVFVAADATTSSELARDMAQTQYDLYRTSGQAYDIRKGLEGSNRSADEVIGMADEEQSALQARRERQMGMVASGVQQLAGAGISLIKNTFGILQDIYNRLKASSPLLQTIESLFNLAMQLFFMPIGNKLAEVILPATLELVDAVVDMWDKFEGKTLPEMIEYAINEGVQIIGDYFTNIGESLQGENDLLNAIGNLLTNIGEFIKNDAVSVLTSLLNVMTFVLEHIKEIVAILISMYTLNAALQILQLYATAVSGSLAGKFGAGLAIAGLASAVAGGIGYGAMGVMGFAEGGYVPATPGGVPAIIGEGGEGEYIIPESKMGGVGGNSYYITINGMTDAELKSYINDIVSQQISQSRLRSGF